MKSTSLEREARWVFEPERYEMCESLRRGLELSRRELLTGAAGALAVLALLPAPGQESGRRTGGFGHELPQDVGAWILIGSDGAITGFTGKVEIGQNIRTSLSQVIAEELRVPISSVTLVMGDTSLTPFDMGTFGSMTTPRMAPQLRRAAAAARETLIDMASAYWHVERSTLTAQDGHIRDGSSGRTIQYGKLTNGVRIARVIEAEEPVTPPAQWRVEGQPVHKLHAADFVTGRHRYASDMTRPGMLFGRILRPDSFGATLAHLESSAAQALPGVKVVHDGNFVGVVSPDQHVAGNALQALKAAWKPGSPQPSSADLFQYLEEHPTERQGFGGPEAQEAGNPDQALAVAPVKLTGRYTVAYIAHAPLEPRAALAEWTGDYVTVWTGTQRPFAVKGEVAAALNVPEDNVRVLVPDMGAGYGGKHTGEVAVEASRLARAVGRPVKVVWTREEEFTWAYFRPAGVIEISSGTSPEGLVQGWSMENINSGGAGLDTPYNVTNKRLKFQPADSPLRQGSYRALAATANHFAREVHMDEIARAVRIDPAAFRQKNIANPRLAAVLRAATERFGWGQGSRRPGSGIGVACGIEKGGHIATCAQVSMDKASGRPRVASVVTAFDCGAVINPDGLRNQIQGATMMGIGGALYEHIEFANGKILNPYFSSYRVPRFSDMPDIDVALVDRKDLPSAGAGETPVVTIAPAISNALFDLTGERRRSMPMAPSTG